MKRLTLLGILTYALLGTCAAQINEALFNGLDNVGYSIQRSNQGQGFITAGSVWDDDANEWDIVVKSIDDHGALRWVKRFDFGRDDRAMHIASTYFGYAVTGYYTSGDQTLMIVLPLDEQGDYTQWGSALVLGARSFTHTVGIHITEVEDQHLLISGFAAEELVVGAEKDAMICKIDPSGNPVWWQFLKSPHQGADDFDMASNAEPIPEAEGYMITGSLNIDQPGFDEAHQGVLAVMLDQNSGQILRDASFLTAQTCTTNYQIHASGVDIHVDQDLGKIVLLYNGSSIQNTQGSPGYKKIGLLSFDFALTQTDNKTYRRSTEIFVAQQILESNTPHELYVGGFMAPLGSGIDEVSPYVIRVDRYSLDPIAGVRIYDLEYDQVIYEGDSLLALAHNGPYSLCTDNNIISGQGPYVFAPKYMTLGSAGRINMITHYVDHHIGLGFVRLDQNLEGTCGWQDDVLEVEPALSFEGSVELAEQIIYYGFVATESQPLVTSVVKCCERIEGVLGGIVDWPLHIRATLNNSQNTSTVVDIAVDDCGDVYAIGTFGFAYSIDDSFGNSEHAGTMPAGSNGLDRRLFLAKFDVQGQLIWIAEGTTSLYEDHHLDYGYYFTPGNGIGNGGFENMHIDLDEAGNVYFGMAYRQELQFILANGNTIYHPFNNDTDIFLMKLLPSGGLLWETVIGAAGYHDRLGDIAVQNQLNGFYVIGDGMNYPGDISIQALSPITGVPTHDMNTGISSDRAPSLEAESNRLFYNAATEIGAVNLGLNTTFWTNTVTPPYVDGSPATSGHAHYTDIEYGGDNQIFVADGNGITAFDANSGLFDWHKSTSDIRDLAGTDMGIVVLSHTLTSPQAFDSDQHVEFYDSFGNLAWQHIATGNLRGHMRSAVEVFGPEIYYSGHYANGSLGANLVSQTYNNAVTVSLDGYIQRVSTSSGAPLRKAAPKPHAEAFQTPDIRLYPNPAVSGVTVSLEELPDHGNGTLQLLDLHGKVLDLQQVNVGQSVYKLNMTSFASGLYFVRVAVGGEVMTKKLWKR